MNSSTISSVSPAYTMGSETFKDSAAPELGGKAYNLFKLQNAGLPVPRFFCVRISAYQVCTQQVNEKVSRILGQIDYQNFSSVSAASKKIQALILDCELNHQVKQEILAQLAAFPDSTKFSVRSSAVSEDGVEFSFAGQLETWLNVAVGDVLQNIKKCWASAFNPGVLSYQNKTQQPSPLSNPVSVVVQTMVDASSAGVLFQADPRGNLDNELINAAYGLGEGVVANKVESDLYTYDKVGDDWQLQINPKLHKLIAADEGIKKVPVSSAMTNQAVLSDQQRGELMQASVAIGELYDHYQDIEWCFDQEGQLHILQSRPITTIAQGQFRVFDNSNIAESYPGIVLPMTFSLFRLDYTLCMTGLLRRFGFADKSIKRMHEPLDHMIGYVHGRAYYNMNNWYQVLSMVPFFRQNLTDYFEQMIGSDGAKKEMLELVSMPLWERVTTSFRVPFLLPFHFLRVDKLVTGYFAETKPWSDQVKVEGDSSDVMIARFYRHAYRFMESLHVPIMNDVFVMICMAVCRKQFANSGLADSDSVLNNLLSNQKIESSKPVLLLNQLANKVGADSQLQTAINGLVEKHSEKTAEKLGLEQISSVLESHGHGDFSAELTNYIDRYAHRCPRELIMEADTYRESPIQLLILLQQLAANPTTKKHKGENSNAQLEAQVRGLKNGWLLSWLLKRTRKVIAHRELLRLDRGLHFGYFRSMLHAIGDQLVIEDALDQSDLVFYLTLDELNDYRQGSTASSDINALAKMRQQQAESWGASKLPSKLFTSGSVYANQMPIQTEKQIVTSGDTLAGTGCSAGQVTAPALVVSDPNQAGDVSGKILVSESTDPGWVFLMTLSAGLVSERGSLLSHTAIIGRELDIPTVVNVEGATSAIKTGDVIRVDGKQGCVEILSRASDLDSE